MLRLPAGGDRVRPILVINVQHAEIMKERGPQRMVAIECLSKVGNRGAAYIT